MKKRHFLNTWERNNMDTFLAKISNLINKYKSVLIVFLLVPSFYTGNEKYFGQLYGYIYYLLPWPILLFLLIDYFIIKKKKPSALMISFFVFHIWMILEQLRVSSYDYLNYCNIIRSISIVLIIEGYIDDSKKELLNALMIIFEVLLYLDSVSIIVNLINSDPKGYTFLGWYNNIIVFTLPAICVAALYWMITKKKTRPIILCVVSVVITFLSSAATPKGSMIGFLGCLMVELLLLYKLKVKKLRLWPWVLAALLFNVFIVFFYREGLVPVLDDFIINILHRSLTFSGRTYIWDDAIKTIMKSPIFGYGYVPLSPLGIDMAPHPHNEILNTWMRFGIIGVIMYSVFSYIYMNKIERMKTDHFKALFIALVFAIYLAFITDWISRSYLYYIIFFLAYHFDKLKS